ncbi:MAG: hypothetical protein A2X35_01555 [Elusimicrobia bacterium GWA2_61_42]|nr:MAG: hypothetical protein A2X35_01555 [Elusimicrobia bacterium GWA2_61_42]OGR76833.1 MAG: hypothetical protein A2X38_11730 [Elusimicrobia bacterium GWC2_61_25]
MKQIILITLSVLVTAGPLMAGNLENLRKSSENISIDTAGLQKKTAAAPKGKTASARRYEITPAPAQAPRVSTNPVQDLAKLIVTLLKLIFNPNGDIEISNPPAEVPQVEGILEDDQAEEQYSEAQTYKPLEPADYQETPAAQQPQSFQEFLHPQAAADRSGEIPADLKRKALEYFHANSGRIANKKYLAIVDFAAHSSKTRFFILNLETGGVHAMHVAHGAGSDPDADGYSTRFSNVPNSKASSLGFYLTGALYSGSHGKSMRLHGLSSTNSNVLSRAVVIHESAYVREANVRQGRSFGCLAVANTEIRKVLSSLNGGALIYAGLSNSDF